MTTTRFETRKMKDIKVKAVVNGIPCWCIPSGYGIYDTQRNEFVIITEGDFFTAYKRRQVVDVIVSQFNEFGASYGNDNLKLIQRI